MEEKKDIDRMMMSYAAFILKRRDFTELRNICVQGMAGGLMIRSFAWKVVSICNCSYSLVLFQKLQTKVHG